MHPKKYVVWSKGEIDLHDSFQKKLYYRQVLINGRAEDVAAIDWEEIKKYLSGLNLPVYINRVWESYFNASV
jgi:hypothetical protein